MIVSSRRGSVLIVVLFVSVVLGLIAISLSYRSALILRASRHRAIMTKLQAQADSVMAIALMRLSENAADFDHPAQSWHTHGPLAAEGWIDDWAAHDGEYVADYRVTDEEGKRHVLLASSKSLEKLGMSNNQIACLFDYMDDDDYSRTGGAESAYYQALASPRRCKNSPIETLDELLAIKGFSPADYWGLRDSEAGVTGGWTALLTTCGDGKVNINTAPRAVLGTLGISEAAVDQIDAFRTFDAFSSGRIEDHAFVTSEDIEQLQGLSDTDRQMLAGRTVFQSEHFRILITVRHVPTNLKITVDVLVRRSGNTVDVLQRRRVW